MSYYRVALAQVNVTVGDLKGNIARIADYIERAAEFAPDIICFPEMSVCGYPTEDLVFKPHFLKDNKAALMDLARGTRGLEAVVIAGFADSSLQNKVYNAAAVIYQGRVAAVYHKIYLPNYGVFDEKRYFLPGRDCPVFIYKDISFGVTICEDIWPGEGPAKYQARQGKAGLLINISASPYHKGKHALRVQVLKRQAVENETVVCYVNLIGGQDELVFDGGSLVVSPGGKIMARGKQFEEDLILADIPVKGIDRGLKSRTGRLRQLGSKQGRKVILNGSDMSRLECRLKVVDLIRPDENQKPGPKCFPQEGKDKQNLVSSDKLCLLTAGENKPDLPKRKISSLNRLEEIYQALVLGTHDYVRKNGFKKAAIGLSGGIDSSLTAAIAVDALSRDDVIGVTMPSTYTSKGTLTDAARQARRLGIRLITLPINKIFGQYLRLLKTEFKGLLPDAAEENLQARIRGSLLMALSNKFGWLVLSTGNKSEMGVGYCTLYGDMAGGFAVIKDVPKTLIYQLAAYRNKRADEALIPASIVRRSPTAELRPGQKDEDSLPPYERLDGILNAYVEEYKGLDEIIKKGYPRDMVKQVIRMVDKSEYKRRQAPPGVKITQLAFGKDRRFPIVNRYNIS